MSSPGRRALTSMSRRRFVQMVTAGSAALLAGSSDSGRDAEAQAPASGPAAPPAAGAKAAKKAPLTPAQKEFDRQRAGTLTTLKTIREQALGPGGDLAYVFRPMTAARKGR